MWADLVLTDGNVLTMNPSQPRAEAIAIKKDRIIKVGANSEVSRWIGKNTEVIGLKGKTVVPGLIDTHIHVADFGRTLAWIDLKEADSIRTLKSLVSDQAAKTTRGKWILGFGWDQENFEEKRYPVRQDLDVAAPENPVILYHRLGRKCVTNSRGLELAGLTKDTATPKDGVIGKDPETVELTGILQGTATDLVWKAVPLLTEQETMEASREACRKIANAGITSIHWIVNSATELLIAQKLSGENGMPLRIFIIVTSGVFEELFPKKCVRPKENLANIGGVLVFADGYLAAQTAALNEPYTFSTNKGKALCTQEELNRLTAKIREANLQVIVHAMGDRAVDAALEAFEASSSVQSRSKKRHRLEQAALLSRTLIQRIKKQKVIVSVQPTVVESEFSVWSAAEHLGKNRARMLFPLKTLLKNRIRFVGGSDCPMEPLSPLVGIQAVVTREFFVQQRITVDEALRMYMIDAAYSSGEEHIKGSIEEGKLADLTILSHDPRKVPSNEIAGIAVEMTIVGGEVVYSKH